MALDKFRAAPLPNPPAEWDPQYMRQVIRVLENYFSQLDSNTPNHAQKYTAEEFAGGNVSANNVVATNVVTDSLQFNNGVGTYLTTGGLSTSGLISGGHLNGNQITDKLMVNDVYAKMLYGDGRYITVPYNQFQSQVDQTAIAIDQAYAVRLEISDFADGIYISGPTNTRITFKQPGVYTLAYSLSFKNPTNDAQTIDIWFRYNDGTGSVDVPNSNSRFTIPARKSTGHPSYLIAVTPYTGIATGPDVYVEIMWRVSDTNVVMEHLPAVAYSAGVTPAIPATPSALVQANFVSAEYPPVTRVAPLPVFGFGQIGNISVSVT